MKITVWSGCQVVQELNLPNAPGPDISLDPWANLIGTNNEDTHEVPVAYRDGLNKATPATGPIYCTSRYEVPVVGAIRCLLFSRHAPYQHYAALPDKPESFWTWTDAEALA